MRCVGITDKFNFHLSRYRRFMYGKYGTDCANETEKMPSRNSSCKYLRSFSHFLREASKNFPLYNFENEFLATGSFDMKFSYSE